MAKLLYIAFCTVLMAALGFYVGQMVNEGTMRTLTATCAGSAGGVGIGCASVPVLHFWQAQRGRA